MPIDINRNYADRQMEDDIAKKQEKRAELEKMMQDFLAKGGKVEKLEPGSAAGVATLNKDKRPMYTDAEIKKLAKEKEKNGFGDSETSEWYNQ